MPFSSVFKVLYESDHAQALPARPGERIIAVYTMADSGKSGAADGPIDVSRRGFSVRGHDDISSAMTALEPAFMRPSQRREKYFTSIQHYSANMGGCRTIWGR